MFSTRILIIGLYAALNVIAMSMAVCIALFLGVVSVGLAIACAAAYLLIMPFEMLLYVWK